MRLLVAAALTFVCAVASAQITTSTLSGKVTDSEKEAIIGATVQAIHTPSGTSYGTITNIDGRYTIQGMRAGGPYKVTISYVGYQTAVYEDITLALGETYVLNHEVKESSELLDEVVISATASKFSTAKTGAATNISNVQMATLPTVNRSIEDVARMSPYANGMSFAGGDGRSTNFTVDGANFNNNFGLNAGLPGGGNPISVDAIEEMAEQPVDVVFLDENMPGMGGLEALSIIKERYPQVPVIMITKSEEENIMDQAIGGKIADYLIKPVLPNQMLLSIKKNLHESIVRNSEISPSSQTSSWIHQKSN